MAALRLATGGKQSGTAAMSTETTTIDVNITAVTLANTVLLWSYQGATQAPSTASFRGYFLDSDTIRFQRVADDTSDNNVDFKWQVLEFASGITVQHKLINIAQDADAVTVGNGSVSITAVDLDKAFIIHSGCAKGGSTYSGDDEARLSFASTTSVRVDMAGSSPGDHNLALQVVEIDDCDIQTVTSSATNTTEAILNETISTVDSDATIYFGSKELTAGSDFENILWDVHLTSTTNLRLERDGTGSTSMVYTIFVVELTEPGATVQRGEISMNDSTTEVNQDITAVDADLSCVHACGLSNGWPHPACVISTSNEQDWNRVFATLAFVDDDTILSDRDANASTTISHFWWVAEFIEEGGGGGDVPFSPSLAGSGGMSVTFQVDVPLAPSFSGSGSLALASQVDVPFAPAFEGSGELALASQVDVQFAPSFAGSGELAVATGLESEVDCYEIGNADDLIPLGFVQGAAQSFEGNGGFLTRIRVAVKKTNSPGGTLACHIFAHSGTFGTSSVPTGSALATADNSYAATGLSTSTTEIDFYFDGTFELESGTRYCLVLDGVTGNVTDRVDVSTDNTSPTAPGNAAQHTGGSWSALGGEDMIFCVFATIQEDVPLSPSFSGSGALAIVFQVDVPLALPFSGSGAMALATQVDLPFSPSFSGSGGAAAGFAIDVPLSLAFAGSGGIAASLLVEEPGAAITEIIIPEVDAILVLDVFTEEEYMSLLNIWNLALARLGISPVTSAPASDGSDTGDICSGSWPLFKESFLRDAAWDGAKKTAVLSTFKDADGTTAVTPAGSRWSNAYALPSDHVRSIRLNGYENRPGLKSSGGLGGSTGLWEEEVVTNDAGTRARCLLTDDGTAELEYIFLVPDSEITLCPADMRRAMALSFAVEIAPFFGKTQSDILALEAMADASRHGARRTDAQTGAKPTVEDRTIEESFY